MPREDRTLPALSVGCLWALATFTLVVVAMAIITRPAFSTDYSGEVCWLKGPNPFLAEYLVGYLLFASPIGIAAGFAGFMWRYKRPE